MHDSDQQPMAPDTAPAQQALEQVSAVLDLELQRLQLLIERRRAAEQPVTAGSVRSPDTVVRLRRAA